MKADRILQGALALMLVAFCGALYTQLHQTIVNAGDSAPNFTITTDSGKTVTVHDFGGKLLLLNFWATWCPPCVEEIPGLNELATQLGPKGLVILGVSVDTPDSHKQFCTKEGLTFRLLADPEHKVVDAYGSLGHFGPMTIASRNTFLIDPQGKIVKVWTKVDVQHHSEEVLAAIDELKK